MNSLTIQEKAKILSLLVEGMSLRAATRITGCSINTVSKLLCDVGAACTEFSDKALRNLPSKRIQCDEIWAFVGAKQKTRQPTAVCPLALATFGRIRRLTQTAS